MQRWWQRIMFIETRKCWYDIFPITGRLARRGNFLFHLSFPSPEAFMWFIHSFSRGIRCLCDMLAYMLLWLDVSLLQHTQQLTRSTLTCVQITNNLTGKYTTCNASWQWVELWRSLKMDFYFRWRERDKNYSLLDWIVLECKVRACFSFSTFCSRFIFGAYFQWKDVKLTFFFLSCNKAT